MWLLSRLEVDTPRLHYSIWMAVLGAGIGMVMPVLILAVQNSVRPADLGTATSANNYFRQIGGSVGAAVFGTLFADRLADALADRLPARAGGRLPDPESITPQLVHTLPPALRDDYIQAYADAMPRIFLYLVPVLVLGLLIAFFLKEKPLVSQQRPRHRPGDDGAGERPDPAGPFARTPPEVPVLRHGAAPRRDRRAPRGAHAHRHRRAADRARRERRGRAVRAGHAGPGLVRLIAAAGGHQPQAVSVTVGERPVELDIVLGGAGRLAGQVLTADGTPVRDATVTLTNVHGEVVATTRSGREGGYVITELVAGEYTLAASAPAFRPAALPVTVQAARETRQDIELAGGAVLRGTVRAGGGRPVEDARVTLLDAAGNVIDTLTTGPDGTFRFVDLSSGEYTVIAAGLPARRHRAPSGRRRPHGARSSARSRGLSRRPGHGLSCAERADGSLRRCAGLVTASNSRIAAHRHRRGAVRW